MGFWRHVNDSCSLMKGGKYIDQLSDLLGLQQEPLTRSLPNEDNQIFYGISLSVYLPPTVVVLWHCVLIKYKANIVSVHSMKVCGGVQV